MKLFAGRQKDESHVRALFRIKGVDLNFVENHLEKLVKEKYPNAGEAMARFDDARSDFAMEKK